ncbi:MAG: hypothetical protein HRT37_01365 [Alteromonadaceae bacterium]|nr:hypothetical protein [Alteromonadaceae bacterium]
MSVILVRRPGDKNNILAVYPEHIYQDNLLNLGKAKKRKNAFAHNQDLNGCDEKRLAKMVTYNTILSRGFL